MGGALLLVGVAALWVASSEVTQRIFFENSFSKPVLFSYLSQSLFALLLLQKFFGRCNDDDGNPARTSAESGVETGNAEVKGPTDSNTVLRAAVEGRLSVPDPPSAGQQCRFSATLRNSFVVAPIWFFSNLLYNLSLTFTSVASSSIISSLSCVFVLIFGALLGVEGFHRYRFLAVVLNMIGMCCVSFSDVTSSGNRTMLGDALSLTAAVLYAFQTVLIKKLLGSQGERRVSQFLGYLGALCLVFGWPLVLLCHITEIESVEVPSSRTLSLVFMNGLIGGVFSDYLWALAICYTSALAASLALSLTIPFSVLADGILRHSSYSPLYLFGAVLVVIGFILANIDVPSR